jgi:hypothetical protein
MGIRSYTAQKAGLTRAKNTGRPGTIIAECERARREWDAWTPSYWPDDWHRWNIAFEDAAMDLRRIGEVNIPPNPFD